jgi:hypothetical protein
MPTAPYHPRRLAASTSLILALGLLAACAGKATPAVPTATTAAPARTAGTATAARAASSRPRRTLFSRRGTLFAR